MMITTIVGAINTYSLCYSVILFAIHLPLILASYLLIEMKSTFSLSNQHISIRQYGNALAFKHRRMVYNYRLVVVYDKLLLYFRHSFNEAL